ncbi:MAG: glutamine--fructose-6-phosphate transaminase (isomerizing) [Clostridia bacterium]|nr:glutamine--fructose-6-phosphate transaminase (isomerizing) [Clostridia bacterium]
MCGIIGYTGEGNAVPKMTKGLTVLEYRGYDSVGIAAETEDAIEVVKCKGRITSLEEKLEKHPIEGAHCAIGHTRWATHGGPSDVNAHPHKAGNVVLVHNGIIENYKELKDELSKTGTPFLSETDTEVAAATLNACYRPGSDPVKAIREATAKMKGSYAFGILFVDLPGEIYAIRQGSPLILAKGEDGYYLASDMTALLPFTKTYYPLKEGQIAHLTPDSGTLVAGDGRVFEPQWKKTEMTPESAQKGGYEHFMLKEIYEQPEAIVKSASTRITKDGLPDFSVDGILPDFWKPVKNIQIVACGSAMHAGIVGAKLFEEVAKIPASVYIASEYRYHPPLAVEGTIVIPISQSGETADTLAAMNYAKSKGLPTVAIVNAVETTIAREADHRVYTYAGPEIAVATTKGYCTQVSVLFMMAAAAAHACGRISDDEAKALVQSVVKDAPAAVLSMLEKRDYLRELARGLAGKEHIFYIGRGLDYALSMEAALKLKEISYIHCEAYAAGELKHGTISLIEEGTPVIAISTEKALYDKTESNVREVRSRGAKLILICRADAENPERSADSVIYLPINSLAATLFAAMTAVQTIAYETAYLCGCDIDRPRNLAKSVTVE